MGSARARCDRSTFEFDVAWRGVAVFIDGTFFAGKTRRSPTARFYGIASLDEATANLEPSVLGPCLAAAVAAMIERPAWSLNALFGSPDDMTFAWSMTLVRMGSPDGPYQAARDRWGPPGPDHATVELLGGSSGAR